MDSESAKKETPGPLNRKRLRKGTRGQRGECAATVPARQTYLGDSITNAPIVTPMADSSTNAPVVAAMAVSSTNAPVVAAMAVSSTNAPVVTPMTVFSANAFVLTLATVFSSNGAAHTSPGQRPGFSSPYHRALKGRPNRCSAPSGFGSFPTAIPRALPRAAISRPFGAEEGGPLMAGDSSTNAPIVTAMAVSSTNGAAYDSPGQRPGFAFPRHRALKGRPNRCSAPSGLGSFPTAIPRALPWAAISRPFRAEEGGPGYGG
jgi:hypothetical protein